MRGSLAVRPAAYASAALIGFICAGCAGGSTDSTDVDVGSPTLSIDGRWRIRDGLLPGQDADWAVELTPDWGRLETLAGTEVDCWEGPVSDPEQALHYGPEYGGEQLDHWISFVAEAPCGSEKEPTRIQGQRPYGTPVFTGVVDDADTYDVNGETWEVRETDQQGMLEVRAGDAVFTMEQVG